MQRSGSIEERIIGISQYQSRGPGLGPAELGRIGELADAAATSCLPAWNRRLALCSSTELD